MTRGSQQFEALEEAWRRRVEAARELYLAADPELKRAARAEYMRVLRVFADLVMNGKIPPEGLAG